MPNGSTIIAPPDDPLVAAARFDPSRLTLPTPVEATMARIADLETEARRVGRERERSVLEGEAIRLGLDLPAPINIELPSPADPRMDELVRSISPRRDPDAEPIRPVPGLSQAILRMGKIKGLSDADLRDTVKILRERESSKLDVESLNIAESGIRGFGNQFTVGLSEFLLSLEGIEELEGFEELVAQGRNAEAVARAAGSIPGFLLGAPQRIISGVTKAKSLKEARTGLKLGLAFLAERAARAPAEVGQALVRDEDLPAEVQQQLYDATIAFMMGPGFQFGGQALVGGAKLTGKGALATARAADVIAGTSVAASGAALRTTGKLVQKNARNYAKALEEAITNDFSVGPFALSAAGGKPVKALTGDVSKQLFGLGKKLGLGKNVDEVKLALRKLGGVDSLSKASKAELDALLTKLKGMEAAQGGATTPSVAPKTSGFLAAVDKAAERIAGVKTVEDKAKVIRGLGDAQARAILERIDGGRIKDPLARSILKNRFSKPAAPSGPLATADDLSKTLGSPKPAAVPPSPPGPPSPGGAGGGRGGKGPPTINMPLNVPEGGAPNRIWGRRLTDYITNSRLLGETYGRIERLAGEAGHRLVSFYRSNHQRTEQITNRYHGQAQRLYTDYTNDELLNFRRQLSGKLPEPTPDDTSRLAKGYREYKQLWDDTFDDAAALEVPMQDGGSLVRVDEWAPGNLPNRQYADAIAFAVFPPEVMEGKSKDFAGRLEQVIREKFRTALAFQWTKMGADADPFAGKLLDAKGNVAKLRRVLLGNQTESEMYRRYKRIEEVLVGEFRRRRVKYEGGDIVTLPDGVEWADKDLPRLRTQVIRYLQHNREKITQDGLSRAPKPETIFAPEAQKKAGTFELHRLIKWPEDVIEQDQKVLIARALEQRARKIADVETFGPRNAMLVKAYSEALTSAAKGSPAEAQERRGTLEDLVKTLHERQVASPYREYSVELIRMRQAGRLARTRAFFSQLFLGQGSRFATGMNDVWGILGSAAVRPHTGRSTIKATGLVHPLFEAGLGASIGFAVGGPPGAAIGGGLGAVTGSARSIAKGSALPLLIAGSSPKALVGGTVVGSQFGDTPGERLRNAAIGGAAGAGGVIGLKNLPAFRRLIQNSPEILRAQRTGAAKNIFTPSRTLSTSGDDITGFVGYGKLADMIDNLPLPQNKAARAATKVFRELTSDWLRADEAYLRTVASNAAIPAAEKTLSIIAKNPDKFLTTKGFNGRYVRALNNWLKVRGTDTVARIIKNGKGFSPSQLETIGFEGAEAASGLASPGLLPISWTSEPGKMITQFFAMTYRYTMNQVGYALNEAQHGNLVPAVRGAVLATAAGLTGRELGRLLSGSELEPRARTKLVRFMEVFGPVMGLIEQPLSLAEPRGGVLVKETLLPASVETMVDWAFEGVHAFGEMMSGAAASKGIDRRLGFRGDPEGVDKGLQRAGRTAVRTIPLLRFAVATQKRIDPTEDQLREQITKQLAEGARNIADSVPMDNPIMRRIADSASFLEFTPQSERQAKRQALETIDKFRDKPLLDRLATQAEDLRAKPEPGLPTPSKIVQGLLNPPEDRTITRTKILETFWKNAVSGQRTRLANSAIAHAKKGNTKSMTADMHKLMFAFGTRPDSLRRSFITAAKGRKEDERNVMEVFNERELWAEYHAGHNTPYYKLVDELASISRPIIESAVVAGTTLAPKQGRLDHFQGVLDVFEARGISREQAIAAAVGAKTLNRILR